MATYHIISKKQKAHAAEIDAAIEDGRKMRPPSFGVPVNECEDCHAITPLTQRTEWGRLCDGCRVAREASTDQEET